jgi:hypothetical protein
MSIFPASAADLHVRHAPMSVLAAFSYSTHS